ncbi:MAG: hypothetical protein MUD14_25680 [Hydrococcus sp. Prado102]|jgi:Tfp pilus assembly protein PilV|nr:hypothetical protein [Hydrococcus sp. Prado102]
MIAKKWSLPYHLSKVFQQKKNLGISLVELLVTLVIASMAISGLLAAMVELLRTDQQESVREDTQQEMQAALSFIAEDLRESVYVYDGTQTRANNTAHSIYDYLPSNLSTVGKPILAFWKAEPISAAQEATLQSMNCNSFTGARRDECTALKSRRRTYTLVVYLQSATADPKWKGKSRILRYELPKYTSSNFASLTTTTGFVDPVEANNFPTWPFNAQDANLQAARPILTQSPPEVLVDFVDAPNTNNDDNLPTDITTYCSNKFGSDYVRVPADNTYKSFFACVRRIGNDIGQNQDVILYIRGNTYGKAGTDKEQYMPLQTRITLRGVIDKFN